LTNVEQGNACIYAKIQLAQNLGISASGSDQVNAAVNQTQDPNGLWSAVGWFYDEPSGVLTVYFNAVPSDDGAQLLTNIQGIYSTAAFVT
jgi:hypothetical protein